MKTRTPAEEKLQEMATKRMKHSAPTFSRASLIMGCGIQVSGSGPYIEDHRGRRFLDFFDAYGNQAFGYAHPRIVAAIRRQLDLGHTNNSKVFFDEMPVRLAEALAGLTNHALPCSFFTNGGAESIEHALKLARVNTRRPKFITAKNAYHGKTFAAMSACCRPEYEAMFSPLMPEFHPVPFGDIAAMEQAIDKDTAAVMIETIQTEGGIVVPPDGYLRQVRELCDKRGALLILDEVQAGFGRTGRFFAFEHYGVLPDIICIGKSFGGGMLPVAAILAREELWTPFRVEPLSFGSSLGGSPLSSAVGLEAIAISTDPAFLQSVRDKGAEVKRRVEAMARAYPDLISSTHGVGLLYGVTLTDPALVGLVLRLMYDQGVVTTFCVFDVSVIRIEPPLILSDEELKQGLDALEAALKETAAYVRSLPAGAVGDYQIKITIDVPASPDALFASLRNPDFLYRNSPIVIDHSQSDTGQFACDGRVDDIPIQWDDTLVITPERREIEQRAVSGFWQVFTRRWTVQPGADTHSSRLAFHMAWDVGTGGFERVLSLHLRRSLEKATKQTLSALNAPVAV